MVQVVSDRSFTICFEKWKTYTKYPALLTNKEEQHYYLLAYLSNLVNNSIIIDLGTHVGTSALALAFNNSNKILTYDITNTMPCKVEIE